jgi:hypothetical protein
VTSLVNSRPVCEFGSKITIDFLSAAVTQVTAAGKDYSYAGTVNNSN